MSDRPAPPAKPPAPPRTPTQARSPQTKGKAGGASTGSSNGNGQVPSAQPARGPQPTVPPPAEPPAAPVADAGDTVVRPGLAERIQAKLASARSGSDERPADEADAAVPATAPTRKPRPRGPRRARLRLTRIDPWSVMKTSFLLSIAFGIVTVIAVAMIWQVIDAAGVWKSINDAINEVVTEPGNEPFNIEDYVGTDRVLGFTMLVAAVDVILITAIATLGAFLYNMSAALLGGIEVTLAEDN
ncbi:DUF3566 domain-containing protein [Nocardioides sp. C4-1]|uniref:DUF3566 domain-containing protein n=1 Tax=Nocardioides sp. C4-1 TaxID=3151851 RepID=UPI0032641EF0